MSSAYSNRLVGSIVVVALVVIFLPDFLDGKKVSHKEQFKSIPPAPSYQSSTESIHFNQEQYDSLQEKATIPLSDEVALDESVVDIPSQEETTVSSPTKIEETNQTQFKRPAWVIQLGSFKDEKNVGNLVNKLKREGYLVFTKPIQTKAGKLTKVYIGPDLDKQKLDAMIPDLNKLTNTSGKLAIYQPTE